MLWCVLCDACVRHKLIPRTQSFAISLFRLHFPPLIRMNFGRRTSEWHWPNTKPLIWNFATLSGGALMMSAFNQPIHRWSNYSIFTKYLPETRPVNEYQFFSTPLFHMKIEDEDEWIHTRCMVFFTINRVKWESFTAKFSVWLNAFHQELALLLAYTHLFTC